MMLTDCFASCTEGNMLHALREYSRKLLIVRPNARTRLEILRGLLEFMKRPDVIRELLTREFCDLLKAVWNYTRSDDGHTLTYVRNSGSLKFQLHVVCLRILDMVLEHDTVMFLSLNIIHTEELSRLLDLVDAKNKHVYCCLDNLTTTWSKQQTATAHQHLSGNTFGMLRKKISNKKTRYGELLEVVLTTEHGNMLVSELLFSHNICSVPHFRSYSPDSLDTDAILDTCRISQVISPQYVWIQFEEDWGTLDKIQQELNKPSFELMPLPSDYTDEDVIVRLSETGFTFRARILEGSTALGGEPAEVLAIDFGWTCTVPKKDIYQKRRVLGKSHDYNIACLCKLADVIPTESNDKALILGSLKVLHRITQNLTFATAAFSNPTHQTLLLSLLYNSHDLDTARHVLYVLANAAADRQIGRALLDPVTAHVGQYMECADVMRPVMLFYRTVVGKNLKVVQKLAEGPGMGLIMKIFSEHQKDEVIKAHFVDIAREVFKGYEISEEKPETPNTISSLPLVSSAPRVRPPYNPGAIPDFKQKFSQGEELRNYKIYMGEKCAFVQHANNARYRNEIAKELISMLNHEGGDIFVGVVPDEKGTIMGLKLDRKMSDDINLLIDDIMTDKDILKRTNGSLTISPSLVEVKFEQINNTFNQKLDFKEKLHIAIISVKPLGPSSGLVMFNVTRDRASVDYNPSQYEWKFYGRNSQGKCDMSVNDVRQRVANSGLL